MDAAACSSIFDSRVHGHHILKKAFLFPPTEQFYATLLLPPVGLGKCRSIYTIL